METANIISIGVFQAKCQLLGQMSTLNWKCISCYATLYESSLTPMFQNQLKGIASFFHMLRYYIQSRFDELILYSDTYFPYSALRISFAAYLIKNKL